MGSGLFLKSCWECCERFFKVYTPRVLQIVNLLSLCTARFFFFSGSFLISFFYWMYIYKTHNWTVLTHCYDLHEREQRKIFLIRNYSVALAVSQARLLEREGRTL